MKTQDLWRELKISFITMLSLLTILCGFYPLAVWGIGQALFSHKANGSLMEQQGKIIGSSLICQSFTRPEYFHPRPSAAGDIGYDGASSGGSNLGPLSKQLVDQVKERINYYRQENGLTEDILIPADAVTASASGLDPHISLKNARLQTVRVAMARSMNPADMEKAIQEATEGPSFGFLGDPGVNVLKLNISLDGMKKVTDAR